jgi:hypothetical protein
LAAQYLEEVYYYHKNCCPGMWACIAILFAFIVMLRIGSFLALKFLNFQNR